MNEKFPQMDIASPTLDVMQLECDEGLVMECAGCRRRWRIHYITVFSHIMGEWRDRRGRRVLVGDGKELYCLECAPVYCLSPSH